MWHKNIHCDPNLVVDRNADRDLEYLHTDFHGHADADQHLDADVGYGYLYLYDDTDADPHTDQHADEYTYGYFNRNFDGD